MHIMPTNVAKTFVWKYDYDAKLWRHKKRTPNTNDHHMPLNEPPSMKIFCVRHCLPPVFLLVNKILFAMNHFLAGQKNGNRKNNNGFLNATTFQEAKHFCDNCLPCFVVFVQTPPCEWQIYTFAPVLHHLEIWKHLLSGHYRSCSCNEVHSICLALLSYHLENTLRTGENNNSLCWTCWPLSMMCLQKICGLIQALNLRWNCSS